MNGLKKILILGLSGAAGMLLGALVLFLSLKLGLYPDAFYDTETPMKNATEFKHALFGGVGWAWIFGISIGCGYIFSETSRKLWFLWAPVYIPVLYIIGALTYYS